MPFWLWLVISLCLVVYVTVLFVRSLRRKGPIAMAVKRWLVHIVDILSGGG